MTMRRPARQSTSRRRKAIVILAVLVVVAILSLAAYQFNDLMSAEYKASDTSLKLVKARANAESGIHVAMAALSNPDVMTNTLNNNPFDNSAFFQGQPIQSSERQQGRYSIVAPLSPDDGGQTTAGLRFRYGVIDESGKINLNSLLQWDSTGQKGHDMLMLLEPYGMTEDIANSILDWLDPDDDMRTNGAESNYYQTLSPPYNAKNGPLDSLDELLLVKGVTAQLLYGNDLNRNGILDPEEDDGSGQVNVGWQAFLTVYTHENNVDSTGAPRIYLNDSDINSLFQKLQAAVGDDLANYIIAYRLYGAAGGNAGAGGGAAAGANASATAPISDADKTTVVNQIQQAMQNTSGQQQLKKINSLFDLLNSSVSVTVNGGGGNGGGGAGGGSGGGAGNSTTIRAFSITGDGRVTTVTTVTTTSRSIRYPCPLNDTNQRAALLPILLDQMTTTQDTDSPGKVNVNTAPQAVLATLPGLTDTDVQSIMSMRPDPSSGDAPDTIFQTLAWLITDANIDSNKVKALEKQITARTQVYRVQSIGYFDGEGPTVRLEAVIDTNNGRPRILARRDLTELGKGFDVQSGQ